MFLTFSVPEYNVGDNMLVRNHTRAKGSKIYHIILYHAFI